MRTYALFFALILGFSAPPLSADDADAARGRLPDGRAFRTDAQGNQLVDYIAELELSVEQLNRRVQGLEFEVEERQRQVERLSRKSGSSSDTLSERDLLGSGEGQPTGNAERQMAFNAPREAFPSERQADCSAQIASTQQLLEKARFDLEVARRVQDKSRADYEDTVERLRAEYSSLKCPAADCSAEVSKAAAGAQKVRDEAEQMKLAVAAEREAQQKRISDYEATLASLRSELGARDSQVKDLEVKLASLSSRPQPEPAASPVAVAQLPAVAAREEAPAAREAARPGAAPVFGAGGSEQRASLSSAKSRAVDSLRGSMVGDLNRLRDLIATRDSLFRGFNQDGKSLTFKPSQLVSNRGYTLSWVQERVKSASNVYELSALAKDIREIRSRVQEDIDLIKRMKRGN